MSTLHPPHPPNTHTLVYLVHAIRAFSFLRHVGSERLVLINRALRYLTLRFVADTFIAPTIASLSKDCLVWR